jgi:hypothetical protein
LFTLYNYPSIYLPEITKYCLNNVYWRIALTLGAEYAEEQIPAGQNNNERLSQTRMKEVSSRNRFGRALIRFERIDPFRMKKLAAHVQSKLVCTFRESHS